MGAIKNININITTFIPKYKKTTGCTCDELSFFAIFCIFNKRDELVNNNKCINKKKIKIKLYNLNKIIKNYLNIYYQKLSNH